MTEAAVKGCDKQDMILQKLHEFYDTHPDVSMIADIIQGNSDVSLRLIDWFVTNYSKHTDVCYVVDGKPVNVRLNYKNQLKGYSKKFLDPFCRRDRINFELKPLGITLETTVGQLNFFKWAYTYKVLHYIIEHRSVIEVDMNTGTRAVHATAVAPTVPRTRKKRQELSQAASKSVTFHAGMKIILDFS